MRDPGSLVDHRFLDVGERGAGTLLIENASRVVNTAGGYVGFIGGSRQRDRRWLSRRGTATFFK
jgi:hypothetical protein